MKEKTNHLTINNKNKNKQKSLIGHHVANSLAKYTAMHWLIMKRSSFGSKRRFGCFFKKTSAKKRKHKKHFPFDNSPFSLKSTRSLASELAFARYFEMFCL